MESHGVALLDLGRELRAAGYRFVTPSPETHRRVNARKGSAAGASATDIFGWSRPFPQEALPAHWIDLMERGEVLESQGNMLASKVRFSSLGPALFMHSAYPTNGADAVFFGPDTYRFVRLATDALARRPAPRRIVDVGCGSGAGGICLAMALGDAEVVLGDINPVALRFAAINAALNGVANISFVTSDVLQGIDGHADLIVANPPYLVDPLARLYRHGGGFLGFDLSLRIVREGLHKLAPDGSLLLYTGSAIVDGRDLFHESISGELSAAGCGFDYEEVDPDVFGEELEQSPYDLADRIAVVALTVTRAAKGIH